MSITIVGLVAFIATVIHNVFVISCRGYPVSLPWLTRLKIAVSTAKGLAFLHGEEQPVSLIQRFQSFQHTVGLGCANSDNKIAAIMFPDMDRLQHIHL
ncbi:hypothetical protein AgCh_011071 [Apium graveolens]